MKVHHTNIRVTDPLPEVAFYRALGFKLCGCARLGALYTLYLAPPEGDHMIELTVNENAGQDWPTDMGVGHIAIVVEDLDQCLGDLRKEGVTPVIEPMHPNNRPDIRVAFLEGPSGYRVELIDGGTFVPPKEDLPSSLGAYDV